MKKTLGSSLFMFNAESQNYCWRETIMCMKEFADEIAIVDAGSTDGSAELLVEFTDKFTDYKTKILCLPTSEWEAQHGREKLSYFSNIAHSMLGTDYFFNLQADEILSENSYDAVRKAIETGHEAFLCSRINLWGNSQHMLNVEQHRKPVSTEVIRLAKRGYESFDDAESLRVQCVPNFVHDIRIYHMGFVRNKYIHTNKIKHMMEQVFETPNDQKVEDMKGVFDPWINFSKQDVIPIQEPLPKIIQKWAAETDAINDFKI